jgi:hypothetical protein
MHVRGYFCDGLRFAEWPAPNGAWRPNMEESCPPFDGPGMGELREVLMRKRLWAGVVGLALCSCGSDPGYEPSYGGGSTAKSFFASEPRASTSPSPEAPRETVEAMQSCADRLAPKLSTGQRAILFDVVATKDGKVAEVLVNDSMLGGGELEACLTAALKQMTVPASVTRPQKQGVTPDSRGMVGVVQAAAAPIALAPIALVVGGVAILAVVTVAVASGNVTVDEVLDAARRRRPKPTKNRCLDAAAGGQYMWYELCRAIAITDPVKAEGCWALAEDGSEEQKRNWCNGVKF